MKGTRNEMHQQSVNELDSPPNILASKIGLVSRDYNKGDFSDCFEEILKVLDKKGCDTALFSLYTFLEMEKTDILGRLARLRLENLKNIFVELSLGKLEDYLEKSETGVPLNLLDNVVYFRDGKDWKQYRYRQVFGSLNKKPKPHIAKLDIPKYYVENFPTKRIMGNVAVVLCGETNIVKRNKKTSKIEDAHGFLKAVPEKTIILNPIHDRMIRPEMKQKRESLSKGGRWVLSVWNKGRKFGESKKTRDGVNPPWTVFHNGCEVTIEVKVEELPLDFCTNPKIEIGIVDTSMNSK